MTFVTKNDNPGYLKVCKADRPEFLKVPGAACPGNNIGPRAGHLGYLEIGTKASCPGT